MANSELPGLERARLVVSLMQARRDVGEAIRINDANAERLARQAVDAAKRGLGERGPPWRSDGAPDQNRRMARDLPHVEWYAMLCIEQPC